MVKFLFKIMRRIIISSFLLYGYNLLIQPTGLMVPINIFTILAITVLGVPALLALIFIMILIY